MLVVEELWEPEADLWYPELENVLTALEGVDAAVDERPVERVVVEVRDGDGELREQRDRVEQHGNGDDQQGKPGSQLFDPRDTGEAPRHEPHLFGPGGAAS